MWEPTALSLVSYLNIKSHGEKYQKICIKKSFIGNRQNIPTKTNSKDVRHYKENITPIWSQSIFRVWFADVEGLNSIDTTLLKH